MRHDSSYSSWCNRARDRCGVVRRARSCSNPTKASPTRRLSSTSAAGSAPFAGYASSSAPRAWSTPCTMPRGAAAPHLHRDSSSKSSPSLAERRRRARAVDAGIALPARCQARDCLSVSKSEVALWLKEHDLKPWRKKLGAFRSSPKNSASGWKMFSTSTKNRSILLSR